MHFLEQLSLQGFRSIKELDNFTLGPITVFVGANGSGKSNLIGFFRLMSNVMQGGLQRFLQDGGGASNFLHFGPARTRFLSATVRFRSGSGLNTYRCELAFAAIDRLIFLTKRCSSSALERTLRASSPLKTTNPRKAR